MLDKKCWFWWAHLGALIDNIPSVEVAMSVTGYPLDAGAIRERPGLRDEVYDLVLDMLVSSDLPPGSRLSIEMVARDLRVSPTPVREALVKLERTGLITREVRKGYRIAPPISDRQLEAFFDTRRVIEGGTAELAAKHAVTLVPLLEEALTQQREITKRVQSASTHGDIPLELLREYFYIDWGFHRLIYQSTGNEFLINMSEPISTRTHRMRQTVISGVSDAESALVEHGRIVAAFAHGPRAAGDAMRDHIEKTRVRSRRDAMNRIGTTLSPDSGEPS